MPKVKVFMLGRFEIVANGTEVIKSLGSSKKRIVLLEYLILNRDKPILMKDLFEVLWPGENSTNPESALKTLVSRLRATLSDYSPDLSDCIITERGGTAGIRRLIARSTSSPLKLPATMCCAQHPSRRRSARRLQR